MKTKFLSLMAVALMIAACDSALNTEPTASIDASTALGTRRGIELGLNGVYRSTLTASLWGRAEVVYPDLYADNLDFTGTFSTDREVSLRNVTVTNGNVLGIWQDAYVGINRANSVIDALPGVKDMTDPEKTLAKSEALFVRALLYSVLARWFGGVPIVTQHSEGAGPEANVARSTLQETYQRIESDLTEAVNGLPSGRSNGRATKGAAQALLARVSLDQLKNTQARDNATAVINNAIYKLNTSFVDNWKTKNSAESIFEIQSTLNSTNSLAFWYYPVALGGRYGFAPSASLNGAFEAGDARKAVTIQVAPNGSRYGNKFTRINTQDDNIPVLRLAEMYLIRAEANARLGASAATVLADVNAVRRRAGLGDLDPAVVSTQTALLDAILQERRVEFALEDQRFFDLRRFGRAVSVLGISADKQLFPIPQADRDINPNLTQNPGY